VTQTTQPQPAPRPASRVPGPRGLPLVGVLPQLLHDPLGFLTAAARRYDGFLRLDLGRIQLYLASDPAVVRQMLQEQYQVFTKSSESSPVAPIFGNGLLASDGGFWLRQRRMIQPVFHQARLAGFSRTIADLTAGMLDRWQSAPGPVEALAEFKLLTQGIILRTMFSSEAPTNAAALARHFETVLSFSQLALFRGLDVLMRLPSPARGRFRWALHELDAAVEQMIIQRTTQAERPPDLLTMLLEVQDADTGERMTRRQLRDEVFSIYLAGHETTAIMLAWACYLLAGHPEVQARVQAEADGVLGGGRPDVGHLAQLGYTRMVLEETMRLYPPAWLSARNTRADTTIRGHPIPAGARVLFSPYLTHRDPRFWEAPERFDPERFAPEAAARRPKFAYYPFGGGPHLCIGQGFALMEAQIALVMIAQRFQLDPEPGRPAAPRIATTLRPHPGVWLRLRRRSVR